VVLYFLARPLVLFLTVFVDLITAVAVGSFIAAVPNSKSSKQYRYK
jgi:MFS superfamily sulfate permease-like transporter